MRLQPGTRLGPYEVESLIGSGGMGEVYRATDTRLHRHVAIKVLPEALGASPVATERFQREARTASVLNHPNICTIYDVGGSPPFIAMELLEGESLDHRLQRGALDLESLVNIGIATAEGLEAAHSHGFIHRDIKPANIFLTARGPKLLDFGLAKAHLAATTGLSSDKTRPPETLLTDSGVTVGTIAYMSPEQLHGKELDARTDIFSLGLVLYEMATGRPAFAGRTSAALSAAILHEPVRPPSQINPAIPAQLEAIILETLEKDREDRCQTAADLRADLRRFRRHLESTPALETDTKSGVSGRAQTVPTPASSDTRIVLDLITRHRVGVGVAVLIASVAALAGVAYWRSTTTPARPLLSLDGVRVAQLTSTGDAERPAIAPDGNYLAYVRQQDGSYSLHVRQTATAATVEIVRAEPGVQLFGATVSPDSRFVDYVRRAEGQGFELWRVAFLGGVAKRVLAPVHSPISWSPDQSRFAFIRADFARGTTAVVVANADGTGERVLAERQRPAQFSSLLISSRPGVAPGWSPDGHVLAVVGAGAGTDPAEGDLEFIDVASGRGRTLPLPTNAVRGLAWFDKDLLVLNAALPDGSLQLHQLTYPSGRLEPLTRDVNDYDGVSLAADGRTLISARRERRTELVVVDTAGRLVANGPGIDEVALRTNVTTIHWAGERVVYGEWAWTPGTPPQHLLNDAQDTTATSDGRTIVFRRGNGLWKAEAAGGPHTLLASGDAWHPSITPDNRSVIFLSSRTGIQSPWIVSIDGGEPRQLVNTYASGPGIDISPDGRFIVFPTRDEDLQQGVALVCNALNCGDRKIFSDLGLVRLRWTPDGRALTFVDAATRRNLWITPVAGGTPTQLTHFEDRAIVDFDWSSDGSQVVLARRLETNDVVMLQGLRREDGR